ncbi:hypothetical protein JCM11641_005523 [Rhodosporidiobolus odoratus]
MNNPLLQEHPPPITPLSSATSSLLRSTTILPSIPQILQELVQNSLDAHATRIHATVDLDTWSLKCDDNGIGIPATQLDQLGRYSTSKLPSHTQPATDTLLSAVDTYGFRGEALASMVDLATLELRSRAQGEHQTHEAVLRDGEVLRRGSTGVQRTGQGTTVCVRDIFWKFPVRRRPLEKASAEQTLRTFLRTSLATLALVHPAVSFSLVDTTSSLSASLGEGKTILHLSKATEGVLGRWKQLWGRAGVEKVWEFDEVEEGADMSRVRTSGFISLSAAHSKASQHIFVNSRPLSPQSSPLHKFLNTLMSASSFSRHAVSHLSFPAATPGSTSSPPPGSTKASRKSPKKAVERHPVFFMRLDVPSGCVDVSLEPAKRVVEFADSKRIEAFLTSIVKRFLVENGFAHVASAAAVPTPAPAPSAIGAKQTPKKRARDEAGEVSAREMMPSAGEMRSRKRKARPEEEEGTKEWRQGQDGLPASHASRMHSEVPVANPFLTVPPAIGDFEVAREDEAQKAQRWVDPVTQQVFLIDRRTGNSWREGTRPDLEPSSTATEKAGEGEGCERCWGGKARDRGIVERGRLKRSWEDSKRDNEAEEVPEWLRTTLDDWENPIFAPSPHAGQASMPSLPSLPTPASVLRSTSTANPTPTLASVFTSCKRSTSTFMSAATPAKRSAAAAPPALTHTRLKKMSNFFSSAALPTPAPAQAPTMTSLRAASPSPLSSNGAGRFTRDDLEKAEVIAQVDCKFLLVRLPPPSAPASTGAGITLVLVDQHAASERIRVEGFWEALAGRVARGEDVEVKRLGGGGNGEEKGEKVGVVVSSREVEEVAKWEGEFERWGIRFDPSPSSTCSPSVSSPSAAGQDYAQLFISTVPALLAIRLASEPKTAQELVRSFLAELRERRAPPRGLGVKEERHAVAGDGSAGWVGKVKDAPVVIKELVESKACRGAIMFNDGLTPQQCASLLASLAKTHFPFQCAHGRPSLVPLVNLPALPTSFEAMSGEGGGGTGVDWTRLK